MCVCVHGNVHERKYFGLAKDEKKPILKSHQNDYHYETKHYRVLCKREKKTKKKQILVSKEHFNESHFIQTL